MLPHPGKVLNDFTHRYLSGMSEASEFPWNQIPATSPLHIQTQNLFDNYF